MTETQENLLQSLKSEDQPVGESIREWLKPVAFADPGAAFACLKRLFKAPGAEDLQTLLPILLSLLTDAASPDRALINFEHFLATEEVPSSIFRSLIREPRLLENLIVIFAGSQFLTDILLRNPPYFEYFQTRTQLMESKTKQWFLSECESAVQCCDSFDERLRALRKFQRRELFRIGGADLLGLVDLPRVAGQLTYLAMALIRTALAVVAQETQVDSGDFAVLGLGKLGGRELNYSSDIDLLFLARNGDRAYQRLGERLIDVLSKVTPEGFLYRVDMRLRPWGQVGTLVPTLAENLKYLRESGAVWEKQAMYKGRMLAGDEILGIEFLQEAKRLIAKLKPEPLRLEMKKMKQKVERDLKRRGRQWGQVKAGAGSIRDVEFVTQYLQQIHGRQHPEVHSRNTLDGLARLRTCGILPSSEFGILAGGYTFLRSTEHHLQIMHYRQTHQIPEDERELAYLARRLGFRGKDVAEQFLTRYKQHSSAIREIYRYYILTDQKRNAETLTTAHQQSKVAAAEARRHLARMDTSYVFAFSDDEIALHVQMANDLNHERPVQVRADQIGELDWRLTIVAYDYLGELSLICGLLFDYGLNIIDGRIFTYEPEQRTESARFTPANRGRRRLPRDSRRKIVDVFTVRSVGESIPQDVWQAYAGELTLFIKQLREKKQRDVHGELAKRVARALPRLSIPQQAVLPVDISIDNHTSEKYTILRIDAPDTVGFMFELTNALALNGIYISRVMISSLGKRVHDTLFVTDIQGRKISDPERQHYLRAAMALVQHFTHLLPNSPNPESALLHFGELVANLFSHLEWPKELASLDRPDVLSALAKLLGVSDFLWNDFLRIQHANLFPVLNDLQTLGITKSRETLREELWRALEQADTLESKRTRLNAFKDREMFRIDMRYINDHITEFDQFTRELSELAEVVVQTAFRICLVDIESCFGTPLLPDNRVCRSSVCGLGKFGGHEVGLASDIELLFVYEDQGETSGPEKISNGEFFEKLLNAVRRTITAKQAGIFELDLRLRPYGEAGNLAVTLDSFDQYYCPEGPAWDYEKQALVKLRPVWGDPEFSERIIGLRDQFLYERPVFNVAALQAMRERQVRQLVQGGTVNAKFSAGGLVDLEYLIQGLQLRYANNFKDLRVTNTAEAMKALATHGILSEQDFSVLQPAHLFLRRLIEALRMVRGNAKDLTVPPVESQDFQFLARRLDYGDDPQRLQNDLVRYSIGVHEIAKKLLT